MPKLTSEESESLHYHVVYGAPGEPPAERVVPSSELLQSYPIQQPQTASWDQVIPKSELSKLLLGFSPKDMDDKWYIYTLGPDDEGKATIHMHRSWTSYQCYVIAFQVELDAAGKAKEDIRFTSITWETDESRLVGVKEGDAKETALALCRWCLFVKLP